MVMEAQEEGINAVRNAVERVRAVGGTIEEIRCGALAYRKLGFGHEAIVAMLDGLPVIHDPKMISINIYVGPQRQYP